MSQFLPCDDDFDELIAAADYAGLPAPYQAQLREMVRIRRVERRLRAEAPERIARLETLATEALDDSERGWHWLRTPTHLFGGSTPLDVACRDEDGTKEVETLLLRIEHTTYT